MKPLFNITAAAVLILSLAACATSMPQPQVTPVIATDDDQRAFAGVWRGRVESADERFAGEIEFRFQPGGAVVFPLRSVPSRILWIRLAGDRVTGALEPYFDGARGADIYTTFDGTLTGGILRGTLRERVNMQWHDAATWSVQRVEN